MGNKQGGLRSEVIAELEETTPFNRAEINNALSIFRKLHEQYQNQPHDGERLISLMETEDGFANPDCTLPIDFIAENFTQLKNNPFKHQICKAFCVSGQGVMSFIEFVDMVSSFSPNADLDKKVNHAFQIFDFDHDNLLSRSDLYNLIDVMTPKDESRDKQEWQSTKDWIVNGVFNECNKGSADGLASSDIIEQQPDSVSLTSTQRRTEDGLTVEDFRYCVYRSPDFINTFSFNL